MYVYIYIYIYIYICGELTGALSPKKGAGAESLEGTKGGGGVNQGY